MCVSSRLRTEAGPGSGSNSHGKIVSIESSWVWLLVFVEGSVESKVM